MKFNFESTENREFEEFSDNQINSEQLVETEDGFEDCSLNGAKYGAFNEVDSESLKEAEDNFEDCESKIEEMKEENPDSEDNEDENFDDCGKENEGEYVAEVTYTTDGDADFDKVDAEIQEAYNECDDPEDMQQLKDNLNATGDIEVINAEVVERPEDTLDETTEAEYEEAEREYEKAQENLEEQQEAAEEYKDKLDKKDNTDEFQGRRASETEDQNQETDENSENKEQEFKDKSYEIDTEDVSDDKDENDNNDGINSKGEFDESEIELTADDIASLDRDDEVDIEKFDKDEITKDAVETIEKKVENDLSKEAEKTLASDLEEKFDNKFEDGKLEAGEAQDAINEQVEEKVETFEVANEDASEKIVDSAEETADSEEQMSQDESKEKAEEDASEAIEYDLSEEEVEEIIEEKSEEIDETIEEKQENAKLEEDAEEITEEIVTEEETGIQEKKEKNISEKIDLIFGKDNITNAEVNDLLAENTEMLKVTIDEQSVVKADMSKMFNDIMSKERGTEEYKQALQEYNALKDQKEELDEKIAAIADQQDRLEKKKFELREAQISKGEATAAVSAITLDEVRTLEGRFDEEFYNEKRDKTELGKLRDENVRCIKELSDEKTSLKLAMDAKMDRISDYVYSNNMGRYETSVDPYYKQLIQEYLYLKSAYDSVGYSIVKLDENDLQISEFLNEGYVSRWEILLNSVVNKNTLDFVDSDENIVDDFKKTLENFKNITTPAREMVHVNEYYEYKNIYDKLDIFDISQEYKDVLVNRFVNMDVNLKSKYNRYADQLVCLDASYIESDKNGVPQDAAYFSYVEGGFKFNYDFDLNNPLGAGNTFFHESGHMLDWLIGKNDEMGNASVQCFMTDAVIEDYYDALGRIQRDNQCDLQAAQEILSDELMSNPIASNCVSDVFGGVSYNKVSGVWGHSTGYWQQHSREIIGEEAFAEITADRACKNIDSLSFTEKYLPKTLKTYEIALKQGGKANAYV